MTEVRYGELSGIREDGGVSSSIILKREETQQLSVLKLAFLNEYHSYSNQTSSIVSAILYSVYLMASSVVKGTEVSLERGSVVCSVGYHGETIFLERYALPRMLLLSIYELPRAICLPRSIFARTTVTYCGREVW